MVQESEQMLKLIPPRTSCPLSITLRTTAKISPTCSRILARTDEKIPSTLRFRGLADEYQMARLKRFGFIPSRFVRPVL